MRGFLYFFVTFCMAICAQARTCHDVLFEAQFGIGVARWHEEQLSAERMQAATGVAKPLKYTAIETVDGIKFSESDLFKSTSDLIIGVDVEGHTRGHTYLKIEKTRVDGRMFYRPHSVENESSVLSPGLIIRFKNIPEANKEALREWLDKSEVLKAPTCVAFACTVLYKFGGFENGPGGIFRRYWFPSSLLKHLAVNGLVGADGHPIEFEIYTLNSDISRFWKDLPSMQTVPGFIFKVFRAP